MDADAISRGRAAARQLPARYRSTSDRILSLLRSLGARLDAIEHPEDRHVVEAMAQEWFPDTIDAFLAIPARRRRTVYERTGQRPDDELEAALESMRATLERINADVNDAAHRNLALHAAFLRERAAIPGAAARSEDVRPIRVADLATDHPVTALCRCYAEVLRTRTGSRGLSDWTSAIPGAPTGVAIGTPGEREQLMATATRLDLDTTTPGIGAHVSRLLDAAAANPFTAELTYGYPVVSGVVDGERVRAPLVVVPVDVEEGEGRNRRAIAPRELTPRLNLVPFQGLVPPGRREEFVARITALVPALPAGRDSFQALVDVLVEEVPQLDPTSWDGAFDALPRPRRDDALQLVDQAVLQLLPRTSWFLAADLEAMARGGADGSLAPPVRRLLDLDPPAGAPDAAAIDPAEARCLPFDANPAQEQVLTNLLDDRQTLVRLDGPPGTGKSQTIANVVSHFVAAGRSVLVTSTRDPAIAVVEQMLGELEDPTIPIAVLGNNRRRLRGRLARAPIGERPAGRIDARAAQRRLEACHVERLRLAERLADAVRAQHQRRVADDACEAAGATVGARVARARARWATRRASRVPTATIACDLLDARIAERAHARTLVRSRSAERIAAGDARSIEVRNRAARIVGRSAATAQYDLFEQLRADPDGARALIELFPVWLASPEDVARLFPCEAELFDLVIVDEASQVDLPSALPVLQRGHQALVSGDLQQMQPRRLSFVSTMTVDEVWRRTRVHELDPEELLHPHRGSLLEAAQARAVASSMLDEHFRSLPPLIEFSNRRWYDGRLRVMTDARRKRFGSADTPVMSVEQVAGSVEPGTQVNDVEARRLVEIVRELLVDPRYAGATLGVICLFREQADHVRRLLQDEVGAGPRERRLLVGQPDQLQGDERDVVLFSLSFDAAGMEQAQLSARMSADVHVQGMLNVMVTRARDEARIVTSAPASAFRFGSGGESALSAWLSHALGVQARAPSRFVTEPDAPYGDVAAAARGLLDWPGLVVHVNVVACGLVVPLVVEVADAAPVAIECDGDVDPDADPFAPSPAERVEILTRGGFDVQRITWDDVSEQRLPERLREACLPRVPVAQRAKPVASG